MIDLKVKLKTKDDLEQQSKYFTEQLRSAAKDSTADSKSKSELKISYPAEIIDQIKERRKARRIWHRTRNPADKTTFNQVSNHVNQLIKNYKQDCVGDYLISLGPQADTDYSLWKATRKFKQPVVHVSPLRNSQGQWVRSNNEKAETFAQYLATVFQPHNIQTNINPLPEYQIESTFSPVTPMEVAQEIDNNFNKKKAPGIDELSPGLFKELSRKAVIMLTYLYNACFRLQHIPSCFKIAQIIMIKKPDKPAEQVTSYRPISLLPAMSKLFGNYF